MSSVERTIEDVAFDLAETNELSKYSKDEREKLRKLFFTLADKEVQCATKTVVVPEWVDDIKEYVESYHGDWVPDLDTFDEESGRLVLTEKASSKEFSLVVSPDGEDEVVVDSKGKEALGFVVSRSIRATTPRFDLERVATHDPTLYARITDDPKVPPYAAQIFEWIVSKSSWGQEAHSQVCEFENEWLETNPQPRPLKDEKEIKMADKAKLKKYYLISPPSTAVLNVRLAKEEEL